MAYIHDSRMNARLIASNRLWFALLASLFVAVALSLPRFDYPFSDRKTAAIGVLLLFTLELPFFFWLLILRPRKAHPVYAVPVAALGYVFCRFWSPGHDSAWIASAWMVLAPFEILLLAVLARRASRLVSVARGLPRSADVIERLMIAAERESPNRWVGMLAYEAGLIYYAFGGAPGIVQSAGDVAFSYHRRAGLRMIYVVALVIGAFEIVGLHLLVAALSRSAAWLLTGLELYGVVWMIGLLRTVDRLPVVLREHGIQVRFGVLYTLFVPYEHIENVERNRMHTQRTRRSGYLNCAFMNAPDCFVRLREPLRARLPYTMGRDVDEIGLMVDEPQAFLAQLEERIALDRRNP